MLLGQVCLDKTIHIVYSNCILKLYRKVEGILFTIELHIRVVFYTYKVTIVGKICTFKKHVQYKNRKSGTCGFFQAKRREFHQHHTRQRRLMICYTKKSPI